MGLAIAKGIVEAHGGAIWIEDAGGEPGTRVIFTLPIGDEDVPAATQAADGDSVAHVSAETPSSAGNVS